MRSRNKDEYGFDPETESEYKKSSEYRYADEYAGKSAEDSEPPVFKNPAEEYYGKKSGKTDDTEKKSVLKRNIIKRLMFAITAGTVATLSIVLAANNLDPLKSDFLMTGNLSPVSSSPSASSSSSETTSTSETTTSPAETTSETTAETTTVVPIIYTDSFPVLPNLDPDFDGNATYDHTPEQYIRIGDDYTDCKYIVMGKQWEEMRDETTGKVYYGKIYDVPGVSYDKNTNTLTLDNYKDGDKISVNLMGNGFNINLVGDNYVDCVEMWGFKYGGSVTFTGNGSITINKNNKYGIGLILYCEQSPSCIMIDREATVDIFGTQAAVIVSSTTLNDPIYTLQPIEMTGSKYTFCYYKFDIENNATNYDSAYYYTDEYGNILTDKDGNKIITGCSYNPISGADYYDHSVIDEDGTLSKHVVFKPGE